MDRCPHRGLAVLQNSTRLPTPVFYPRMAAQSMLVRSSMSGSPQLVEQPIAQLVRSAALIAASRSVLLNGLSRTLTAPCSSALARTASSVWAVTKTVGTSGLEAAASVQFESAHSTAISWSKCRPRNNSSTGTNPRTHPSSLNQIVAFVRCLLYYQAPRINLTGVSVQTCAAGPAKTPSIR